MTAPTFRMFLGTGVRPVLQPTGQENGDTFGRSLFQMAASELCASIEVERARGDGDALRVGDYAAYLRHFAGMVPMIAMHHAANAGRVDANGFAWWLSARRAYAAAVTDLLTQATEEHVAQLPPTSNLAAGAVDGLAELVAAFLFPDDEACRRSEDWKRERLEVFDAIRATVREIKGWDPDLSSPEV